MTTFTAYDQPFPYVVIYNLFNNDQFDEMSQEWLLLQPNALGPEFTATAKTGDGTNLKQNSGIFLDDVYAHNRTASPTLRYNRKLFDAEFTTQLENANPIWGLVRSSTADKTLISYYKNNDYYQRHYDYATLTALTWLLPQGDTFTGGKLKFTDYDISISPQPNITILFPGCIWHEVTPIKGNDGVLRVTMSQFIQHNR